MRSSWQLAGLALVTACGSVDATHLADAPPAIDAAPPAIDAAAPAIDAAAPAIDASIADASLPDALAVDASPMCQPTTLLVGGTDVGPQGWSIVMQAPAMLTYGPDYVRLQTTTAPSASVSGQLLLNYPGAFDGTQPFKLQIVLLVELVNPHNQFDAAVAILGSFNPPFGVPADRSQMIYIDSGAIGWSDDTQSFAANIQNNAYHTYELAVDAGRVAHVTIDGGPALTRSNFVSNGALAIGDQTNDHDVDSVLRIRSVTKLCP